MGVKLYCDIFLKAMVLECCVKSLDTFLVHRSNAARKNIIQCRTTLLCDDYSHSHGYFFSISWVTSSIE